MSSFCFIGTRYQKILSLIPSVIRMAGSSIDQRIINKDAIPCGYHGLAARKTLEKSKWVLFKSSIENDLGIVEKNQFVGCVADNFSKKPLQL